MEFFLHVELTVLCQQAFGNTAVQRNASVTILLIVLSQLLYYSDHTIHHLILNPMQL